MLPVMERNPAPAFELPATRAAWRRRAWRSALWLAGGLALLVGVGHLAPLVGLAGFALTLIGLVAAVQALRIRRALKKWPWTSWPCRYAEVVTGVAPNGEPTLLLGEAQDHVLAVLGVFWSWRVLESCDGQAVWLAGDPGRGGVVSPPGGKHLLWARRPRTNRWRRSLRRRVVER